MSTSPLQTILSLCTPEERQWIRDIVRPDRDWRVADDYDESNRRFYQKQWDLLRAAQDPNDASVPEWFRQRRLEAQELFRLSKEQEQASLQEPTP